MEQLTHRKATNEDQPTYGKAADQACLTNEYATTELVLKRKWHLPNEKAT